MAGVPAGSGALVGKRLGHYEIVALLALGGTAEIYLARTTGTAGFEKYVVVKCLHDHLAEDREFVQMFLDEARLGAQLDHSNIVQTLGLGEQDGRYYLVMEFIAGMSLALLARRAVERVPGGRIPVPLVLGIAAQACAGLHYAHERESGGRPLNLVHRDISPQNLVITFEGDVRIVDFGIAKAEERQTATRSGTIKGKFAYMSPEQCHAKDIDRRTDVFALGVVVHELLTGRRLFKRGSTYETYQAILECRVPPPSAVNHELDPALDAVVMKALTKHPNDRYQSAEAFGEAITTYLHSRGKLAGASEISAFIQQHFMAEVDDHADRMRELLEGRITAAGGWDDVDPHTGSIGAASDVEELSQFDVVEGTNFPRAGLDDLPPPDPDEPPVDATRIEMNPMMEHFEPPRPAAPPRMTPTPALRPMTPVPPLEPAPAPAPPAPAPSALGSLGPPPKPRAPTPTFGAKGLGASIFGSGAAGAVPPGAPPAGASPGAPSAPPAPAPGKSIFDSPTGNKLPPLGRKVVAPSSPSEIGRPNDKTAPTGVAAFPAGAIAPPPMPAATPRSRASTEPAPVPGSKAFGPQNPAALSTVIAEPQPVRVATPPGTTPVAPAAAPEARTMMLAPISDDDPPPPPARAERPLAARGLPASFEAVLSDDPPDTHATRDAIARGATVPAMDAVAPELQGHVPADQPTYRAPFVDPLQPKPELKPLPFLTPTLPPSGEVKSLTPPPMPGAVVTPPPFGAVVTPPPFTPQPFPSGELLVPPHGTPPGTPPSPDGSLPAHLIGLPPSDAYPRYDGSYPIPKLRRGFPGWVIPVAISVAAAVVIGIVAAVAS